jgi:enoyl-CoA hydratase
LRQTLHIDYRLACRLLESHDFYEGVRAIVVEKTGVPDWSPARVEDITPVMVESMFAPLGADELTLPTRQEMQAART